MKTFLVLDSQRNKYGIKGTKAAKTGSNGNSPTINDDSYVFGRNPTCHMRQI